MKTNDEIRRNNLLIAIKRAGTAAKLADKAGVASAYLSQIKNKSPDSKTGKPKSMGDDVARKIEVALGVPEGWMDAAHSGESNVEPTTRGGQVPLISWVRAGSWCEAADIYNVGDAEEWLSCPVRHGPRTYALRVRGESMRNPGNKPSFEDGDIIFVDPDREASHKSLVITKLDQSNEVTFKRLLIDGASWYLEALNPSWPNRIIPIQTDAHVCGVVIARMESFI